MTTCKKLTEDDRKAVLSMIDKLGRSHKCAKLKNPTQLVLEAISHALPPHKRPRGAFTTNCPRNVHWLSCAEKYIERTVNKSRSIFVS